MVFSIDRLLPLLMVIISGALLLVSIVASAALASATNFLDLYWPGTTASTNAINFWFLFVLTFLIFALMYKYVPNVPIRWADVWPGALATALLFSAGRLLIGWYLASQQRGVGLWGGEFTCHSLVVYLLFSTGILPGSRVYPGLWPYLRYAACRASINRAGYSGDTATDDRGSQWEDRASSQCPQAQFRQMTRRTGGYETEMTTAAASKRGHPRLQRIARPVAQAGMAVGVIALLSIVNLVAGPLRREKKPE